MESWVLTGAVAVLAVGVVALALLVRRQGRLVAELQGELRAERRAERAAGTPPSASAPPVAAHAEPGPTAAPDYVITHLGDPEPEPEPYVVPDRIVLSATLGEPLVKAMALSHGLRRALSAESRNRIGFEVRREVKRSRKVRRREMREAWRRMKTERAAEARSASSAADAVDGRDVA